MLQKIPYFISFSFGKIVGQQGEKLKRGIFFGMKVQNFKRMKAFHNFAHQRCNKHIFEIYLTIHE